MRSRLSFSDVVACLALFVALGGTSYAVIRLPRNSVGSSQVRNRSLQAVDLAQGVLKGGVRGARGPEGPTGRDGPAGATGPSDVVVANRNKIFMALAGPSAVDVITINLPAGEWSLNASASVVQFGPADFFRCNLTYAGEVGGSASVARVGADGGATSAAILAVQEGRVLSAPAAVRLRCGHDVNLPGGDPRVDHAQITAVRTEHLDIQPG